MLLTKTSDIGSYLLTDVALCLFSRASGALGEAIDKAFSEDDTQQIAVLLLYSLIVLQRGKKF